MIFEKCPDKTASIDFSIKATLVSESISGDTLSQYSDNMSVGSGPESEFEFADFENNEEGKQGIRKRFGQMGGRKPANVLMAPLKKQSQDPNRPPMYMNH